MNKYSGIDLHSNNSVVVITNDTDKVLVEKRMPNELTAILALLEPHREELIGIVVESTYNWYWLVDGLQAAGFTVHLANTTAIKSYDGLKHSNDESDAAYLAHLLRLGILRTAHIYPKEQRAVRDLARKRMQLVRSRTQHILAIENIVARETAVSIKSNDVKRLTEESVSTLGLRLDVDLAVQANVAVVETINSQIAHLEKRLQERVRPCPEYALLTSVPGIGQTLATTILLETGAIERFREVGHYASYARCVDSVRLSNGKKKGEGNVKNGNVYLSWAFVEAAHFACRYCIEAKRFFDKKRSKTNNAVATKALAHKLARACYHMLKEKKEFDVKRCFA
jgi:transposase